MAKAVLSAHLDQRVLLRLKLSTQCLAFQGGNSLAGPHAHVSSGQTHPGSAIQILHAPLDTKDTAVGLLQGQLHVAEAQSLLLQHVTVRLDGSQEEWAGVTPNLS